MNGRLFFHPADPVGLGSTGLMQTSDIVNGEDDHANELQVFEHGTLAAVKAGEM